MNFYWLVRKEENMARTPKKASPKSTSASSTSGESILFTYLMASFLVGMLAVLVPFIMSIDCRITGARDDLPWPVSHLVKLKCGPVGKRDISPLTPSSSFIQPEQIPIASQDAPGPPINYGGKLSLTAAGHCIKKSQSPSENICGEDAFAVNVSPKAPATGRSFLAVADGVGGWSMSGGDSSKISTGLLAELKGIVNSTRLQLSEAGQLAFARMAGQRIHKQGSTTVCASILDHDTGNLQVSNVGDSGAFVFRRGRLLMKTKSGQEGFNAPHQLGFDQEGNPYGSFTLMETKYNVPLMPEDIIVLATDGILDNIYDEELREMLVAMIGPLASKAGANPKINPMAETGKAMQERVQSTATSIAWHAWTRSQETHWLSPFAQAALSHGLPYSGGKQDDITIVVAVVSEAS